MREQDGTPAHDVAPAGPPFPVSVLVRTGDSAATVQATLDSIRAQTVDAEVVVVDSGSTDGTLELVAAQVERLVDGSDGSFSYGRALNRAAAAATSDLHVALSAHCVLPHQDWLAAVVRHLSRRGVVAACSADVGPAGRPLTRPLLADHALLTAHPLWGFTNHASAWRREAWALHPFDETLEACEDREWSWRATRDGGVVVLDPELLVPSGHRRAAGLRKYHDRLVRELSTFRRLGVLPHYGPTAAVRDIMGLPRPDGARLSSRPLGRTRLVEVAAHLRAQHHR